MVHRKKCDKEEFVYCSNFLCKREDCARHKNKTEFNIMYKWTKFCNPMKKEKVEDCKYYLKS